MGVYKAKFAVGGIRVHPGQLPLQRRPRGPALVTCQAGARIGKGGHCDARGKSDLGYRGYAIGVAGVTIHDATWRNRLVNGPDRGAVKTVEITKPGARMADRTGGGHFSLIVPMREGLGRSISMG